MKLPITVRVRAVYFLVFIGLALCGCTFFRGSGRLDSFLVNQFVRYGAKNVNTNGVPALEVDWKYRCDRNGFLVRTPGNHFVELDQFVKAVLGPPYRIYAVTPVQTNVAYKALVSGIAVQYSFDETKQETILIGIKPLKDLGLYIRTPKL